MMAKLDNSHHITSLWTLIEGLQQTLENQGVEATTADKAVVAKVASAVRTNTRLVREKLLAW